MKMKMPQLKFPSVPACCCFDLKTGCIIIGILGLIGSILIVLAAGLGLATVDKFQQFIEKNPADGSDAALLTFLISCVGFLIIGLVGIVSNSLLLHGANKGKGDLFMFWLVWTAMSLILSLVLVVVKCAMTKEPADSVVTYLVSFVVSVFLWVVVNSYRKVLARADTQKGMDYMRFQQEGGLE